MKLEKLLFQHGAAAMIADTILKAAKQIGFEETGHKDRKKSA